MKDQMQPPAPPASEARQRASRENGAKSRGPITPQGKRNSSHNAIRHALLAKSIVLGEEDHEAFLRLLNSFRTTLAPINPVADAIVEGMAVSLWRQKRLWAIESSGFREQIEKESADLLPSLRAAHAFRDLADTSRALYLLDRYETRFERQFNRAFRLFEKANRPNKFALPNEPGISFIPNDAPSTTNPTGTRQ